ncbi:MAG: DNA adenine methylase, partial [Deltaproteobacteria bacterium]|nr:DNA adenine methylase [Deltaproteobacteria bacterium]
AFECLAKKIIMVERDDEVAAVWETILNDKNEWLAEKIYTFELSLDNVKKELVKCAASKADTAFVTILKNRIFHGGIIAKGSGLIKKGENGKGIASRWYPKTLRDRILSINRIKHKIDFIHGDAFNIINRFKDDATAVFFIDPPYTVAGKRLYTHFEIDHERLFEMIQRIKGHFLMTYDDTEEVRHWAGKYDLKYKTVPMKTTHHLEKNELLISDNLDW